MPGTYAHYAFGKKVLTQVEGEIKNTILKNMDLFFIGLHGPDILFYYKPLIYNNPTSKLGHNIHNENSNIFFEKARSVIKKSNSKEESLAYILGFLCHFMLDSECHPYINKVTKENNISHTEIESEFDKLLINEEGKNPFNIDLTKHINTNITLCEIISPFFNINTSKILKSLKSMKFYNSIFNTPNKLVRFAIFSGLKISFLYNKLHGVFFNMQDNANCENICKNIKTLYNNSIDKTTLMMDEFYTSLKENTPFPQRLNRNFK